MKTKTAIWASVISVLVYLAFHFVFDTFIGPQMSGMSTLSGPVGLTETTIKNPSWISGVSTAILAIFNVVVWISVALREYKHKNGSLFSISLFLLSVVLVGCGQTDRIVDIGPNQTVFSVPYQDPNQQASSRSVEFYTSHKVDVNRVTVHPSWVSTGGFLGLSGEWKEDVLVLVVDRTPITREWTASPTSGSAANDQSICVESAGSQGICVGVVMSAQVEESDAASFLYYYPQPAGSTADATWLTQIADSQIRPKVAGYLSEQFKDRTLDEAISQANTIFQNVFKSTSEYFKPRGITVNFVENTGGLVYDNPDIQKGIDAQVIAGNNKKLLQATLDAQDLINQQIVSQAKAQAQATTIAGQAGADVLKQQAEVLAQNPALIEYTIAKGWDGKLPLYGGGSTNSLPFIMLMTPQPSTDTAPVATATAVPAQ